MSDNMTEIIAGQRWVDQNEDDWYLTILSTHHTDYLPYVRVKYVDGNVAEIAQDTVRTYYKLDEVKA